MRHYLEADGQPVNYVARTAECYNDIDGTPIAKGSTLSFCAWHNLATLRANLVKAGYIISDSICDECRAKIRF